MRTSGLMVAESRSVWCGVGHLAEDPLDVGPEPDVEHPVGLVEDDVEDVAQVERPPLDVVDDAAGGADDEVDAALQSALSWRSMGSPP